MTRPNLSNERWPLSVYEQRWQRGMVRTLPVPDGAPILTAQGCEDVKPDGEGRFRARVPVEREHLSRWAVGSGVDQFMPRARAPISSLERARFGFGVY